MIHIDQDLEVDDLIEEIEFAFCVGLPHGHNPEKAITLETLYNIITRYFPQIKEHLNKSL